MIFFLHGCMPVKEHKVKLQQSYVNFNDYKIIDFTFPEEGNFIRPKFTDDDKSIAFLSSDLTSLWIKKIGEEKSVRLLDGKNKIIDFVFIGKYDSVFIAERNYEVNAAVKSQIIFIANGNLSQIYSSASSVSSLSLSEKNNLIFFDGGNIKFFDTKNFIPTEKLTDKYSSVLIDTANISVYMNGKTDKINLTNHQHVAWVCPLSEDSLLIYSTEDKLILLSLKLKDIKKIGDYTSPVYNKLYRKIVVIKNTDDGLKETSGDVYLLSLSDMKIKNLTRTPEKIESNARWSNDGKKLVFDVSGQIKYVRFNQSKPITK